MDDTTQVANALDRKFREHGLQFMWPSPGAERFDNLPGVEHAHVGNVHAMGIPPWMVFLWGVTTRYLDTVNFHRVVLEFSKDADLIDELVGRHIIGERSGIREGWSDFGEFHDWVRETIIERGWMP